MRNKNYLILILAYITLYGLFPGLGAILAALTHPYGYGVSDNAIFAAVYCLTGVGSSLLFGIIIDRTKKYKMAICLLTVVGLVSTLLFFVTLPTRLTYLFSLNLAVLGFAVIPMMTLCI